MNFSSIKNIIFDLGGVIINIDFQYTYEAFARLAGTDILTILKKFDELKVFLRYETGELDDAAFRDLIRKEIKPSLTDHQIDNAWNALLLDIPQERIRLIESLKGKYRLFLLSNTNPVHIRKVNEILYQSAGVKQIDDLFEKAFYSYDLGLAKPGEEIYRVVLKEKSLHPEETLFIDDNGDNIRGAITAGLNTIQVRTPETILELLKNA